MENIPRNKIVVGIDGSSESVNALRYASGLASATGHDLVAFASWLPRIVLKDYTPEWAPEQDAHGTLVRAIEQDAHDTLDWAIEQDAHDTLDWAIEQDAHETLDKSIEQAFGANIPENLKREVVMGAAASNLLKASKDAAMVVLGTRGRGGFKGLVMGSVSSSLAAHASCPVLIHHGE
jgi:nucleotide-binding universal stress UspA family protein